LLCVQAVFWFNPSETFIDISDGASTSGNRASRDVFKESHWVSESGEIDFFLISGPSPKDVFAKFTALTGRQDLPPMFALGYHQCRWNYRYNVFLICLVLKRKNNCMGYGLCSLCSDEKDVASVEKNFEQLDYPVDVIWLDIEHTDGKRYFTVRIYSLFAHLPDNSLITLLC
jgi:alpha 1,3-glucosidase